MPQMSPLMWFSLFILFSVVMIMFNQLNFFSYKPYIIKSTKKSTMKSKNQAWKW
uniref:ATP synthase complex subunit 8 n=2 Tax=Chorthippus parallelus TaxID=37639 RepID=A0A8F0WF59_CHOPA|nr:ATP synthase F0 subunit 8 [Chorthippus parallelus parallelus]YP_010133592.1 ATP synthase F0 subunit 8 [Chorthippus parallelus erythropus]QWM92865.1 ATP synthase F0 subunit 8 [Chorthippus parallelus parallelus]QWM92882.1 ATP synthase F0 subunit 8 [Chorthippus parallelus erythropus]QWM92895.1 ATP synthase F0 subunit 8 [Chorthippus parallelus erythropus]QWM92908.1 ATP synthase F0 subunit 8 [Chorthippus parallelus erythropus]